MSDLHAMPITNITHIACYTVEMDVSAGDLTLITLDNNHTAYKHICLQGTGFVCVKKYPPEIMQPSSSTRTTIVSAENQNGATIVKATFFFCHYYIVWGSNNVGEAREQPWNESVIRVVQSENILLRLLRRGHVDDGAVPPSVMVWWCMHCFPRVMNIFLYWTQLKHVRLIYFCEMLSTNCCGRGEFPIQFNHRKFGTLIKPCFYCRTQTRAEVC